MTTETTTAAIDPAPAAPGGLSPDRIAASRDRWISYGHDPAKFDAALAGESAPDAPPSPAKQHPDILNGATKLPSLTREQTASAIAKLRGAGVAEEAIQAAMQADGLTEPSAEQLETAKHDAEWGFGEAHPPEAYKIDYGQAGRRVDIGELAALNKDATEFLSAMQINPALGSALLERTMKVGQAMNAMDDAGRQLFKREQRALGLRSCGGDETKLAETIRLAAVAVKHQRGPASYGHQFPKLAGANDWWVISTLAAHGAQIERWQASRPRRN